MNDKDKEEFEKWFKDFYEVDFNAGNPRFTGQSIAWKYACEYMRNKSNPLDALSLYEKLERERAENKNLQAEIKKLREALEFYADEKNMVSLTGLPFGRRAREALKEAGEL